MLIEAFQQVYFLSLTEELIFILTILFPGSPLSLNAGTCEQLCCKVLQPACVDWGSHADTTKPATNNRQMTFGFRRSGCRKLDFNLWHFDSFEQETKGQMISHMLDHKQENPIKSDRGYAWQTHPLCAVLLCRACFLSLSMSAQFWLISKSCLGCALTQRKFVIFLCAFISCNDN